MSSPPQEVIEWMESLEEEMGRHKLYQQKKQINGPEKGKHTKMKSDRPWMKKWKTAFPCQGEKNSKLKRDGEQWCICCIFSFALVDLAIDYQQQSALSAFVIMLGCWAENSRTMTAYNKINNQWKQTVSRIIIL